MESSVKKTLVTPAMAEIWLLKNTNNRTLKEHIVAEYVYQMKKGAWRLSPDAISFDTTGRLTNGQHRLSAVARSGKAQEFLVVNGLVPESFNITDIGSMRTAGDLLSVNDIAQGRSKAAIARAVMILKKGMSVNRGGDLWKSTKGGFTNEEVLEFVLKHEKQIEEAYQISIKVYRAFKPISAQYIGMLAYLFSRIDATQALAFFELYSSGAGLSKDHPILQLRTKLLSDMTANRKMQLREKLHYMILCWNYYRNNRKVSRLRYDGPEADLPKPI